MSRPQVKEYNCETQKEIIREMNDAEFEQFKKDNLAAKQREAEAEAKATAKAAAQAKLAALGLTVDDLTALGLGGN